jgi:ribonuclease-3
MTAGGEAARGALERRLGYAFTDGSLLATALTHASARAEHRGDNERFEFLGDRVLGLVIAEMLVAAFPQAAEGELSQRLAELVRAETCADVAADLGLAALMRTDKAMKGGQVSKNVLSDACEAVIAAVYLDGGLAAARTFIETQWRERMLRWRVVPKDAKTTLQEWAHARGLAAPTYAIVGREGPSHEPRFAVEAQVDSLAPSRGEGRSRREAEQDAAQAMLFREGVQMDKPDAA